jgi:hypothetical protein
MSKASEYTRKFTVTLETGAAAHELFAYLCTKWNGVEISEAKVTVTHSFNILEDIWYAICDVDVPDKVLSIQLQRITEDNPNKIAGDQ